MQERMRLADADISGRIADLTGSGTGSDGAGGTGLGGAGGTDSGCAGGTGSGDAGGAGAGGTGGTGGMGSTGMCRHGSTGSSGIVGSLGETDGFVPPQEVSPGRIEAYERKISPDGDPARWISLNSWYVIGPFANPARKNIERQFPPETVIDLDGTYIGKNDRILRWKYRTAERLKIIPRNEEPYGIWYATTEVWSDRNRNVWLAMGSDDHGRLWINGDLVWISSNRHKSWTMGEALRRVPLLAGRNRILYRIENGHHGMAFSLCLYLGDQK
jgi:hypothetical protein